MNERDIEFAKQAGFVEYELHDYTESGYDIRYTKFADLIRADEREACAKVCESNQMNSWSCAQLIRARGNT